MEEARKVFDCMPLRDAMWSVLRGAVSMSFGEVGSCIHEFLRVISNEVRPDKFILPLQLPTTLNGLAEQFTGPRQCGYTTL
jgi:hypothetical protein